MKILNSKNKKFDKQIDLLLLKRKNRVKSKNIDQKNEKFILELIGIDQMKNGNNYEINLIFKNNAHITLTTETIEVRLEDQNEIK